MKKVVTLGLTFIITPIFEEAQYIVDIDFNSPLHHKIVGIKKHKKWAFISKEDHLIETLKAGVSYVEFMDKTRKTGIEREIVNGTDYQNGTTIALKLNKNIIDKNTALSKDIINYKCFKVLNVTHGKITYCLTQDGKNMVVDINFLRGVPQLTSNRIKNNAK